MSDEPTTPQERLNAARGYKAALHNPRVSAEAKDHARQMLQQLNEDEARQELELEREEEGMQQHHVAYHRHHARSPGATAREKERPSSPQERINAARGYKAALHNPLVSEEGKEHAAKMLREMDDEEARQEIYTAMEGHKSEARVVGGLRAAQHNPRVSEEGHRRAAEKLHELGYDKPDE